MESIVHYTRAEPFKKVYNALQEICANCNNDTLELVTSLRINQIGGLAAMQEMAIRHKWEGLMFANPEGLYQCGRSHNSLKWKAECETEAIIEGYEDGKTGKNIGKVGAIKAHLEWNEQVISLNGGLPHMVGQEARFKISGLTNEEREWNNCKEKYPIGSTIKFTFYGVSIHGVPQSCNIWRE